jgi:predicted P-loop ATPase
MFEMSIVQNFNKIIDNLSFNAIAEQIRSGKFKRQIDVLQKLIEGGKEKEYAEKKKSLLAFTPSAKFNGGRKPENIEEYNRIIILDFDKIENINSIKEKATNCKYTYSCFLSPSNKGLKILVKTSNSISRHNETFLTLQTFYEELLQVKIDSSGKDVTRLCFFSYDKDLYINNESEIFNIMPNMDNKNDIEKLINKVKETHTDLTSNYEDWVKIGFAIESEFGESGREYFHAISRNNPGYKYEECNDQYSKCLKNNSTGITIKTLFHFAKQHGIKIIPDKPTFKGATKTLTKTDNQNEESKSKKITSNKFTITEEYLSEHYIIRYNTVSNKFEYRDKESELEEYKELNENNLFIKLQKDNINISLNNLISLLKSDFVNEFNPFRAYFESLPEWDGVTDHINNLAEFLKTTDRERLENHFKKWLVRMVRTAIDDNYYNKQALVLVSTQQNSGKSTFCRFLCPPALKDYIVENIGTDKDSLVAITENILINLDELSTAEKNEINAFKSMFSKEKVKARLTYDKRASTHIRRASFIGSTDRWEFLTDENGSVRWLCFDITFIDWKYSKEIDIDLVYSQAYHLLKKSSFVYDLTESEISENDKINKKYQVSNPERDLLQKFFKPGTNGEGQFYTSTDIIEYLTQYTTIRINPVQIGRELKFLGYERVARFIDGNGKYGYLVLEIYNSSQN